MASAKKKTRRNTSGSGRSTRAAAPRSPGPQTATAVAEPTRAATATGVPAQATPAKAASDAPVRRSDNVDWANEYSYVVGDLKQLTVVSVALFAVMIAIGYFL